MGLNGVQYDEEGNEKENIDDSEDNNKSISQTKIKYYKNLNYNNDPNAKNKNTWNKNI